MEAAQVYLDQAASPRYGDHWSGPPEMVDRLVEIMGTRPGDVVADVGCGIGGPAQRLVRTVQCHVVGVDLLPLVVSMARSRAELDEAAGSLRFVAGAAERLPLASGVFDQVWSLGVVAHVPGEPHLAAEVARILRPGGSTCLTEAFWDGRRPPRFAARAPRPWRPIRRADVAAAFGDAGLVDIRSLPWPGRPFQRDADVADPFLRADLLDGRLRSGLVVARKPGPP